jgi:hypothetical protein
LPSPCRHGGEVTDDYDQEEGNGPCAGRDGGSCEGIRGFDDIHK